MPVIHHTGQPRPERSEAEYTAERDGAAAVEPAQRGDTTAVRSARPTAGSRVAAAGTGTAVLIARVIRTVASVVVAIIALGILFVVLDASTSNTVVSHVHSWARWLAGPFDGMFTLHSAKGTVALNWGIAIVVYLVIAWLLARIVLTPARAFRRRTAAV
jgi:hypothetical protein